MSNRSSYKIDRGNGNQKNTVLLVLLLLVVAVLAAFLVALVWQNRDDAKQQSSLSAVNSQVSPPPSSAPVSQPESESSSSEAASSMPETPAVIEGALPESQRVSQSYFDDAVFVGDSVTEGMLYCIGMENARILAGTSVNFATIYTAEVIKLPDGTRTTIMSELPQKPYKKVYIMLGGNEVRDQSKETFVERYSKVLDDVKAAQPDAIYYVQSMTPVTKENNYNMDNKRIDEFNLAIMALAKEKGMYYLNVAESMKNEEGMLPDEASPGDGMHFGQPYFDKWYNYLKTHVAPGSATPDQLASAEKPSSASSSSSGSASSTSSASSAGSVSLVTTG